MQRLPLSALLLLILTLVLVSCTRTSAPTTVAEYSTSIDRSCTSASDCTVKNVGNCCGQYPQCVNTNAQPRPDLLKQLCEKEGIMSVCGFSTPSACECTANMCTAVAGEQIG